MNINLDKINKLTRDEFGRPSGVLLLAKPEGISAHDLVDRVRKQLNYRKVGHAGALDNFSSGLMIILVGKDTKLSDELMHQSKVYRAKIIIGIATDTQDPEGKITKITGVKKYLPAWEKTLHSFVGEYQQFVSPFSSVKVGGKKLRVVMRDVRYQPEIINKDGKRYIKLTSLAESNDNEKNNVKKKLADEQVVTVEIPRKTVQISAIKFLNQGWLTKKQLPYSETEKTKITDSAKFPFIDAEIACSKGTYIRQFAEDFGEKIKLPASLVSLERLQIGDFSLTQALNLAELH